MTLFYRYPDNITDIVCASVVAGDYSKIDEAYDTADATKDSDYVTLDGVDSTYGGDSWRCTFGNMSSFGPTINSITLCVRLAVQGGEIRYGLHVGSTYSYDLSDTAFKVNEPPLTSDFRNYTKVFTTNPDTSAAWKLSELAGIKARFHDQRTVLGRDYISSVYLIVDASPPNPSALTAARMIASCELNSRKMPAQVGTFTGNLDLLAYAPGDLIDLEHTAGFHPTDAGWGSKSWQRRTFEILSLSADLSAGTVRAELRHIRDQRKSVWFPAYSTKAAGVLEDGIARFSTPGSTWTFSRASDQTVTNPLGASETVTQDVPAYTSNGLAILTAAGALAGSRAYFSNNSGYRTWPAAQGRASCEVYLAAVSGAANQSIFYTYHDASNWARCYWDGANGRWVFEVRAAGTTYRAIKSASPSANTTYQIGCRWTGAEGELDATPYTLSIWVDRVKGTDVVAAAMTEAATSNFDIGTLAAVGSEPLNGYIRKITVSPVVWNDTEMARTL